MPTLTTDATSIYYEDAGPRDAPALVLSHSLFLGHWMFEAQATEFASRYRVIRYDHRGQGRSARHPREELDMDTLAADAAALIERLELGPCMFCGVSMGGFVALRLAARRPELLSSVVVAGSSGDREQRIDEFDPLVVQLSAGGVSPVLDVVSQIMLGDTTLTDPARAGLLEQARERLAAVGPEIGDAAWQVVHRSSMVDELPSITVPTLVLAGAEDHVYDVGLSRQIVDLVPDAALEVVEGVGHSLALEDPAAINPLLAGLLERTAVGGTADAPR